MTLPVVALVFDAPALSKQADTSRSPLTSGSGITLMSKYLTVPVNDSVGTSAACRVAWPPGRHLDLHVVAERRHDVPAPGGGGGVRRLPPRGGRPAGALGRERA